MRKQCVPGPLLSFVGPGNEARQILAFPFPGYFIRIPFPRHDHVFTQCYTDYFTANIAEMLTHARAIGTRPLSVFSPRPAPSPGPSAYSLGPGPGTYEVEARLGPAGQGSGYRGSDRVRYRVQSSRTARVQFYKNLFFHRKQLVTAK